MEVPRSKFLETLPTILDKLAAASFVSFDAEYTGLKGNDGDSASLFDTATERYDILREVVFNNSAPQFGISIFERLYGPEYSSKQEYKINAYCFYLTEQCFAGFNMTSIKATFDIDCCEFLNGIGFNYDKWFKESVPYLNENKVKELEKYLNENPNIWEVCKRNLPSADYKFIFGDKTDGRLTEDEKKEIIRKCRGFSVIVDAIAKLKIPVVGHNMALDMMYFFHQFCKNLPEKYEDFKSEVVNYLPEIYDTKYMTVRCRRNLDHPALNHVKKNIEFLKCSGLYMIYKTSSAAVVDKFSPTFVLSSSCEKFRKALEIGKTKELEDEECSSLCHEPSFDACVTGIVFLNLAHIASRIDKSLYIREKAPEFLEIMQYVGHWKNQIFVSRASVMTMCLNGNDPRPDRSWVRVILKNQENEKIDINHIMKELKSDPRLEKQLPGIDHQLVSPTEFIFAVSRMQTGHELCEKFQKMGLEANRVLVPWDKKRWGDADSSKRNIYDTRRNKFFF